MDTPTVVEAEESAHVDVCAHDRTIQKILAVLILIGFFGAIAFMLVSPLPQPGHDALLIMIGALAAAFGMVISYYFGSSSGSAAKTALANRP